MSNPLIDDLNEAGAIPQVEIALPTRAFFYPVGEVLAEGANPDELAVTPISILDESTFRDPLMMISGNAIAKMVRRVCPAITNPGRACEVDIQAILIASRIASYGHEMQLEHKCGCGHSNKIQVDLNQHIQNFGAYTPEDFNDFDVTLPVAGQQVRLRPMIYEDSVDLNISVIKATSGAQALMNTQEETLDEEFIELYRKQFEHTMDTNIRAVAASIFSVTTKDSATRITDHEIIDAWLLKLTPPDVKAITERIAEINNAIRERSKINYTCEDCTEEVGFYLELDPQKLFTQAEELETETNSSANSKSTGKSTKKPSKKSQRLS